MPTACIGNHRGVLLGTASNPHVSDATAAIRCSCNQGRTSRQGPGALVYVYSFHSPDDRKRAMCPVRNKRMSPGTISTLCCDRVYSISSTVMWWSSGNQGMFSARGKSNRTARDTIDADATVMLFFAAPSELTKLQWRLLYI